MRIKVQKTKMINRKQAHNKKQHENLNLKSTVRHNATIRFERES